MTYVIMLLYLLHNKKLVYLIIIIYNKLSFCNLIVNTVCNNIKNC